MADKSRIEWTEATWNPVTGCTKVSQGCKNCYAEREWPRLTKLVPAYAGRAFSDVRCHPERLEQPLHWKKPRRIFVNSMSDLFHDDVQDDFIDQVFAVMALSPQHTFQVLTKRPERMRAYLVGLWRDDEGGGKRITTAVNAALLGSHRSWGECGSTSTAITTISRGSGAREPSMLRSCSDGIGVERLVSWSDGERWLRCADIYAERVRASGFIGSDFGWGLKMWPLPNVWLGVSVEDQATAFERLPLLRATPAAVRWLSIEPCLGPIHLGAIPRGGAGKEGNIHWVVVGGESGPNARPMHPAWVMSLRNQCERSELPFFFKQWGEWAPVSNLPEDTRLDFAHWAWVNSAGGDHIPAFVQFKKKPANHELMGRVGKKLAGRLLDGVLHDEYPEVAR